MRPAPHLFSSRYDVPAHGGWGCAARCASNCSGLGRDSLAVPFVAPPPDMEGEFPTDFYGMNHMMTDMGGTGGGMGGFGCMGGMGFGGVGFGDTSMLGLSSCASGSAGIGIGGMGNPADQVTEMKTDYGLGVDLAAVAQLANQFRPPAPGAITSSIADETAEMLGTAEADDDAAPGRARKSDALSSDAPKVRQVPFGTANPPVAPSVPADLGAMAAPVWSLSNRLSARIPNGSHGSFPLCLRE